ncbi:MAG: NAD+ synthase [Syntrophorhabdaceae bacterium]|nr:NAD+ synthase [Syntrophorhabdaceae bacterium]
MTDSIRIAMCQINPTVGDLKGNKDKILDYLQKAESYDADIICFPELAITGYPPEDLILKPHFVRENINMIKELSKDVGEVIVICGFIDKEEDRVYNAASVIYKGAIYGIYHKALLPNYGVFDEKRYFKPGGEPIVFQYGQIKFGVNICEDIWFKEGPTRFQAMASAALIININASPYQDGKIMVREEVVRSQARESGVFIAYTNMVGGQDELVFDGGSMLLDKEGNVILRANQFVECILYGDIPLASLKKEEDSSKKKGWSHRIIKISDSIPKKKRDPIFSEIFSYLEPEEEIYKALVLGLKDYVFKNKFNKVVIGLSGGIDSSLVCTIACDAIGNENVFGVFMPSKYTSHESREDVFRLVKNLDITIYETPIDSIFESYLYSLNPFFKGLDEGITEENIQARIRGNILMAFSNKFSWLVLTTGNKSEMSVGYATLYGDMAGGFAVIKDIPKTMAYKLCEYRNRKNEIIPRRVLTKEPSAELKPNQKDTDTLPKYELLDTILKAYVEENKSIDDIIVYTGIAANIVHKVIKMIDKSEYKRRQSPPGIKITPLAFGKDRRMPITNQFRSDTTLTKISYSDL